MRILAIADVAEPTLWERLNRSKLEGVDLIISCGDLPPAYLSFLTCFTSAPILYVHGNHDDIYRKNPPEGCFCIDDQIVVFHHLRILGLGGSMRYNQGFYQYTDKEMQKRIAKLRFQLWKYKGVDLLVTHAPAFHIGDDTDLAHTGFQSFVDFMDKYKPAHMLHGHVHQNYHYDFKRVRTYQETEVINAYSYTYLDIDETKLNPALKDSAIFF